METAGPERYSAEQIASWTGFAEDTGFAEFILGRRTLVAEDGSGIIGFSGVDGSGHILSLYVKGDGQRRGIGARLLTAVMEAARADGVSRFTTVASEFSRGLFETFGFAVVEVEMAERRGTMFERYHMALDVGEPEG